MKEALLYKKLLDKKIQCLNCAHRCLILPSNRGICGVRENIDGKLYSLNYAKAIACHIDPIEKKPFFHFLPGSHSLSLATIGCNFRCDNCQNYSISQAPKIQNTKYKIQDTKIWGENLLPEEIVKMALENKLPSISYTYTEPTIFLEYALDTMKIAKSSGLKNTWVTNGFMSEEALNLIAPHLDAANVDLKSFDDKFYQKNCGAKLQPVLDSLKLMKKLGIWVEVTTLVIPGLSDSNENFNDIAQFIYKDLGPETPWHISKFSPEISWKLQHLPETSLKTIEKACQIGLEIGLKYVYSGNVIGQASEDTYCSKCNTVNIDRTGYQIVRLDKNGFCYKCGEDLNLILK